MQATQDELYGYTSPVGYDAQNCETFYGYIATVEDALLLIEATNAGVCSRIKRRLQSKEHSTIRSGSVFVFDEVEANMKRWTDKLLWSPSRQVGSFFVYRQMTTKIPRGASVKQIAAMTSGLAPPAPPLDPQVLAAEKQYVRSLTTSPQYARDGLIKKALCIGTLHVVSYFTFEDVENGRLRTPRGTPAMAGLTISPQLTSLLATSSSTSRSSHHGDESESGSAGTSSLSPGFAAVGHISKSRSTSIDQNAQHAYYDTGSSRSRAYSLPTNDLHQGIPGASHPYAGSMAYSVPGDQYSGMMYPSTSTLRLQAVPTVLDGPSTAPPTQYSQPSYSSSHLYPSTSGVAMDSRKGRLSFGSDSGGFDRPQTYPPNPTPSSYRPPPPRYQPYYNRKPHYSTSPYDGQYGHVPPGASIMSPTEPSAQLPPLSMLSQTSLSQQPMHPSQQQHHASRPPMPATSSSGSASGSATSTGLVGSAPLSPLSAEASLPYWHYQQPPQRSQGVLPLPSDPHSHPQHQQHPQHPQHSLHQHRLPSPQHHYQQSHQ